MRQNKFILLLLLSLPIIAMAQNTSTATGKKATLKITHTADFEISGEGNVKNWASAPWVSLPQRSGDNVKYKTNAKLLYSDKGIYALFECEDNNITATFTKDNDDLYNEDVVEIFFWTDEKYPLYFEYEISPLNYELVLMVPNFNGKFLGWIPWHYEGERKVRHATKILKEGDKVTGWLAEFFIPFDLLEPLKNVPPQKGTQWRMNMYRIDYDQGTSAWSWQPTRINFHDIESFGTLLFD
jgi:hypothetical protein